MSDDSALYEFPSEFLSSIAMADGECEAQSILPAGDRYVGHCTCGRWDIEASTLERGVHLAREHTGSLA